MRILVTGWDNPVGTDIVQTLVASGHHVRVFGGSDPGAVLGPAGDDVLWFPGRVEVGGQLEPALSERQALVHVANLDPPGPDRQAAAVHIEMGTRYARYAAEREQVDHFVVLTPAKASRPLLQAHANAVAEAKRTRGTINTRVVEAQDPQSAAQQVARLLAALPELGKQPGRENDAVTA